MKIIHIYVCICISRTEYSVKMLKPSMQLYEEGKKKKRGLSSMSQFQKSMHDVKAAKNASNAAW